MAEPSQRAKLLDRIHAEIGRKKEALVYENSLIKFVEYVWPVVEPKAPFVTGWAIEAICEHLEAVTRGEIKRLLINIPPGFTKSLLTDVFWPAWEWGPRNRPDLRYVCASYAHHLTIRDNMRCRNVILSDRYKKHWGDRFRVSKEQATKVKFANDKTGWKFATSVGGITGGERGDRFIIDDPNNPTDTESAAIRGGTNQWFLEVVPDRLNDMMKSAIVIIQQRLHEEDVSGIAISKDLGYTHLMIPMEYDPYRHCETSIGWSDPRGCDDNGVTLPDEEREKNDGELAWPERFPPETIIPLKAKGPFAYCTPYEAPILMGDLSMKPIGEVVVGDKIIGFTTNTISSELAEVLSISKSTQKLVRMRLDSGHIVRCTPDHKWYCDASRDLYVKAEVGGALLRACPRVRRDKVVSIEPDGEETVYGLETTTGNYVVWGLLSSNSGQYMQSPEPRGGGIFKRDWWRPWEPADGKFPVFEYVVASLDTAYTSKEENDPSALTVWGVFRDKSDNPKIMLIDAWRKRLEIHGPPIRRQPMESDIEFEARGKLSWGLVEWVAHTCQRRNVDRLLIEAKAAGHSVAQEIRNLYGLSSFGVEIVEPKGDKVARAYAVQHLFSEGLVYAPQKDQFWIDRAMIVIDESASFPKSAHDDLVDSMTQALKHLRLRGMAVRREELLAEQEELKRYRKPLSPLYPSA